MDLATFNINLYRNRFSPRLIAQKKRVWQVLCRHFFQRYIRPSATVLEIGFGYGEFINSIVAARKYAVEVSEINAQYLKPEVTFLRSEFTRIQLPLPDESVDHVFISNFTEHILGKERLIKIFIEIHRIMKKGGTFLILGPNIRYSMDLYWDYFDHHIPLSDRALREVLEALSFRIERCVSRFLPFTTLSRYPKHPLFVWLYLKMPLAWRFLGKQLFIVARKSAESPHAPQMVPPA